MTKTKLSNIVKSSQSGSPRTVKGPEPERLKISGNWKAAVRMAMQKARPPGGWPR
jgi:hypothetical protein